MARPSGLSERRDTRPRVAVVGCGFWGRNLVRSFHELGVLTAVHDVDQERAEAMAAHHGVATAGWTALLGDPDVEAVAIASSAESHAALAGQALAAGKHVFVEKPIALDLHEAEDLCRQADREARCLMVGHLMRYHPAFLRLEDMVGEGVLGRLLYIYSNRLNLGRIRRQEDILWSFAPHDISMILALVGASPDQVAAVGASYLHETIADVTTTHLSFPGGERAQVFVSWLHPYKEQKLVVVGDQAMAVFDDGEPWETKLLVYRHHIAWRNSKPVPQKAEGEPIAVERTEPLRLECAHFLDCIATGATPRTDGREGVRVLSVLRRAATALHKERSVCTIGRYSRPSEAKAHPGVTIHESAYVDEPVKIDVGTRIWHFSHILPGTIIGQSVVIGQNVMIGPNVTIGDGCKIQNNVSVYEGVTLEDGVFCGPSCVFTNVINPRAGIERKNEFRATHVGRGATIGANATILCGIRLGAYCFVAAGAVVLRDVPPHALVAGIPSQRIGWVSHDGERLDANLVCPRSGRRYLETGPDVLVEVVDG